MNIRIYKDGRIHLKLYGKIYTAGSELRIKYLYIYMIKRKYNEN